MTDTHELTRNTRPWQPGRDALPNQRHLDTDRPAYTCDPAALARVPDHIETWLVARYAPARVPSPPRVPLRRRIDWAGVAALVAIALVLVALALLLNRPIVTGR